MKKISILFFFVFQICFSQNQSKTTRFGNFELEFSSEKMSWHELNQYCNNQANGWFIPNPEQMKMIVSRFRFSQDKVLWTSKSGWSGNSNVYSGKQWSDRDMDVAEVLILESKSIESRYKTDKCDFVIARSLGNGLEKVKASINEAYKVGNLLVSKYDLHEVSYNGVLNACERIGGGWRIPTLSELEQIRAAGRQIEADLNPSYYYSADRTCPGCFDSYWALNFTTSRKTQFDKTSVLRAILVKSATDVGSPTLQTLNFGSFLVTKEFFGPMTFQEAERFCLSQSQNARNPWRITTMQQLSSLKQYKKDIPTMIGKRFMSYEYKGGSFNRDDMSTVKIEPIGVEETWYGGSETSKFYFFMSKSN